MRIAIIGGGASGLVTAYLLDKQGHGVTVLERQPILGGHIRTLNKNETSTGDCQEILEGGVLEFPAVFRNFINLMRELEVELEPVKVGSALFLKDGRHFLSAEMIQKNFTGFQRLVEYLRLDTLYARSAGFWLQLQFPKIQEFYNQPLSQHFHKPCVRNDWLKLLTMYSYSMPFEDIDNFPAELAIPALRDYVFVDWLRIKGGVYSYIEKILARFKGKIFLNVDVKTILRNTQSLSIGLGDGTLQEFDKVVFATPPDQVLPLLSNPTEAEERRFSAWRPNYATTMIHCDTSMYARHGIQELSEFDFFETSQGWGYNAYLNRLCGVASDTKYSLGFNLERAIAPAKIIHTLKHHTPFYTVEAFRYRDEVASVNGEGNVYHAGAYLGDGLHEGAIRSALQVAQLIG
ncbi:MAG: FAD-dependent oxidoreductase [Thermosynechococcaceae cyanobacterium]